MVEWTVSARLHKCLSRLSRPAFLPSPMSSKTAYTAKMHVSFGKGVYLSKPADYIGRQWLLYAR